MIKLNTLSDGPGRAIASDLFIAAINSTLLAEMLYEPDTFDFQGQALWKIALDEKYDDCLLPTTLKV